jgi:hypothetical protein
MPDYRAGMPAILYGIFGRKWRPLAPRVVGMDERNLRYMRAGRWEPSYEALERLREAARRAPIEIEAARQAGYAKHDREAEERKLALAGAVTALELMIRERKGDYEKRKAAAITRKLQAAAKRAAKAPPPLAKKITEK